MMYQAKNGTVKQKNWEMDYVRFGTGVRTLIMLPGLGESLRSVKGTALPTALMYRMFAKEFTVYMFSRRTDLPEGWDTRDMARDLSEAMDGLGIEKAAVFGVSMGGMIAQYLAVDHPDRVEKLVLAVTSSRPNPILRESIAEWISFAQRDDHAAFMESNLRRIYSEKYCRQNGWMAPILGKLTKPKSYRRFYIQAQACLKHDAYDALEQITAPTLIIGGERDMALGGEASREMAEKIPGAKLHMYSQLGHGLYEEAPDFNTRVYGFLME